MKVTTDQLKLGDIVKLGWDSYSTATIIKITENEITFFRPYVHTSDFEYSGGVIPYIGTEQFTIPKNKLNTIELIEPGKSFN